MEPLSDSDTSDLYPSDSPAPEDSHPTHYPRRSPPRSARPDPDYDSQDSDDQPLVDPRRTPVVQAPAEPSREIETPKPNPTVDMLVRSTTGADEHKDALLEAEGAASSTDDLKCTCDSHIKDSLVYTIGIFTSVAQYMDDKALDEAMRVLSDRCEYLYFQVPVKDEYDLMRETHAFHDKWAIERTRDEYVAIVQKYWIQVGYNFLESKTFYGNRNSCFSNLFSVHWS